MVDHKYARMSAYSYILNKLVDEGACTGQQMMVERPPHMGDTTPGAAALRLYQRGVLDRVEVKREGRGGRKTYLYEVIDLDKMPATWRDEFTPMSPRNANKIERITPMADHIVTEPPPPQPEAATPEPPAQTHAGWPVGIRIVLRTEAKQYVLNPAEARAVYAQLKELFDGD